MAGDVLYSLGFWIILIGLSSHTWSSKHVYLKETRAGVEVFVFSRSIESSSVSLAVSNLTWSHHLWSFGKVIQINSRLPPNFMRLFAIVQTSFQLLYHHWKGQQLMDLIFIIYCCILFMENLNVKKVKGVCEAVGDSPAWFLVLVTRNQMDPCSKKPLKQCSDKRHKIKSLPTEIYKIWWC